MSVPARLKKSFYYEYKVEGEEKNAVMRAALDFEAIQTHNS